MKFTACTSPSRYYDILIIRRFYSNIYFIILQFRDAVITLLKSIDNDCAIVPRGSYVVDGSKKVIANSYYQGISYDTSLALRGYMHFRYPQSEQGKVLLTKPGIIKSGDFMDCIDKDTPAGTYSLGDIFFSNLLLYEI